MLQKYPRLGIEDDFCDVFSDITMAYAYGTEW